MKTDVQIAAEFTPKPITEVAAELGLSAELLEPYGKDKAKVALQALKNPRQRPGRGRLVLVSAITPTPAGEGKTTTTIGLGQALSRLGESTCLALREPSLGPCMGVKGGATGGGYSQLTPAGSINLHFTGDFHAVTAAHNLLAAALDNHLHHGNALDIDPQRVLWRRVLDMNDRSLRNTIIGLGGVNQGIPRETGFDITAASEVMAMLGLAEGFEDLRARIDRTLVAFSKDGTPITAGQLRVTGAMLALLKDAMMPNLVQTLEGTPTLVHCGPFANIAHGCNSVVATRMALHLADWAITEAGFGFDLGAEKFFDIKATGANLDVDAVVLVATVRALKMHGGRPKKALNVTDVEAVRKGLGNLDKHIENMQRFGVPSVVAINRFADDTDEEIAVISARCEELGVRCAVTDHFARGGAGAEDLARAVIEVANDAPKAFEPLYAWSQPVPEKIEAVATQVYGADSVNWTASAKKDLKVINRLGFAELPICIAKTQSSLSDNPRLRGRPRNFDVTIKRVLINAGAGFLVVMTGNILRMPGLPRVPQAEHIDVENGEIIGIA
ncbi:MAG: formate--tetrahydrofolate ligase [Myxococcales bacterium]|nr:formate--tetrahydrofolate ligase [Myxococcales bacterium]